MASNAFGDSSVSQADIDAMSAAAAGADYGFGGDEDSRGGDGPSFSLAPPSIRSSGYGVMSPGFVQEAIRGFNAPRTQTIAEATGYGGINIAPYSPRAASFSTGRTVRSYSPMGTSEPVRVNLGEAPTVQQPDLSFGERVANRLEGAFRTTPQRSATFDPRTERFTTPTMEKISENRYSDILANLLNPFKGITGALDTATYQPLTGGEDFQFSEARGGLLSAVGLGGPQMKSYSELQAGMGPRDDGDEEPWWRRQQRQKLGYS